MPRQQGVSDEKMMKLTRRWVGGETLAEAEAKELMALFRQRTILHFGRAGALLLVFAYLVYNVLSVLGGAGWEGANWWLLGGAGALLLGGCALFLVLGFSVRKQAKALKADLPQFFGKEGKQ